MEKLSCSTMIGPVLCMINKAWVNKEWLEAYKQKKNRVVIIADSDNKDAVLVNT